MSTLTETANNQIVPTTLAPTPTIEDSLLKCSEVSVQNMSTPGVDQKQYPEKINPVDGSKTPAGTYYQIPINYKFPNGKVDNFVFEGPEMTSFGGIMESVKDGKKTYSMQVKLPMDTCGTFVTKMTEIFTVCCHWVGQVKGSVGKPKFNPNEPGESFKHPIFFPYDKITGNPISGKAPSTFLKLIKSGSGYLETKTLFTDLKKNPIDWRLLYNVEVSFIPVIHIEKIYIGASISLQVKVLSAVVTNLVGRNTVSKQNDTMNRLISSDPSLQSKLEEQIKKLEAERLNTGKKTETPTDAPASKMDGTNGPIALPINPNQPVIPSFANNVPGFGAPLNVPTITQPALSPSNPSNTQVPQFTQPMPSMNFNSPSSPPTTPSLPNINSIVSNFNPIHQ